MTDQLPRYVTELGFELAIPGSAVRRVTDRAKEPGKNVGLSLQKSCIRAFDEYI